MMHDSRFGWKCVVRLCAWTLLVAVFAGPALPAFAQAPAPVMDPADPVEPAGFWVRLVTNLFNSRGLMETLGQPEYTVAAFCAINLIVFVETGLLVFCLPGDSLLVVAGLIASNPLCGWNLPLLLVTLCASAIVGDSVGYMIGFKTGPRIFTREKSFLFKKDHLLKAQQFYEKYGGITIIIARFMPILRTFAPVVAGVGQMEYRRFLSYNVFGGIGWVSSMVLFGYFVPDALNPLLRPLFGDQFLVQDHVEKVVILVVLASISPAIFAWVRTWFAGKPAEKPELAETAR